MSGPSYQQFQGYPNPVGNYFSGLDAGYGRAKEGFNDGQTLETQNALVQQSGAQSYPQLQAQQAQAKQMMEMYQPALQNAIENENYEMRDAIVGALKKSGNPVLGTFADIAATAKKLDKGAYGYDVTFPDTEAGRAQRQAMWSKDAFLQSVYPSADQIQLGVPYRVTTQGMPGAPQSHTTKFEAVSRASAKPVLGTTTIKSEEQLADLEEKYKDRPDVLARLNQARLLLAESPAGVDVSLPEAGGVKASKAQEKYRSDSVSTSEGLMAAVADAPPAIAKKILAEAVPTIKKGYTVVLERDSKGALTGLIRAEKRPPSTGTGGFGSAWKLTPEELAALTRAIDEKRLNPNKVNSRTAKVYAGMELEKPGMSFSGKAADIEADSKSLGFQQKSRDMMASFVLNMNAQIDRVGEIIKDVTRTDVRLLNVPIRKWKTLVAGSAIESKINMYVTEISNELGKLSAGNAASIAELSQGAQKKWADIHDLNLPVSELMSLLRESQHAGNLRTKSMDDVISKTQSRLKGKTAGEPSSPYQTPPAGYKATGQKDSTGAPLYISPSGKIVAAPKAQ